MGSLENITSGDSGGDVGSFGGLGLGFEGRGGSDLTIRGGLGGNFGEKSLRSHRMVRVCSCEHGVERKSVSTWIRNIKYAGSSESFKSRNNGFLKHV